MHSRRLNGLVPSSFILTAATLKTVLHGGFTGGKNGWRTADKKPVKNGELWQELDRLVSQHQIDWRWVKGHAGDPGNEKADALANLGVEAARGERPENYRKIA